MYKNYLMPAIVGGITMSILSLIPGLNFCCPLWSILAGVFAVFLYSRRTLDSLNTMNGVVIGGMAGIVGGLICGGTILLFGASLSYLTEKADSVFSGIVFGLLYGICFAAFALVGGLLGAQIFRRPVAKNSPPPHQ